MTTTSKQLGTVRYDYAGAHVLVTGGTYTQTALGPDETRQHEQARKGYYLDRLRQAGVARPRDFEEAWTAYRCTCAWNIYVGWLPADIDNYGWEICELAHLCAMTAYEAWETAQAIAALDGARLS